MSDTKHPRVFENPGCFSQSVAYMKDQRYGSAEWWIRTWTGYGFGKHTIVGTFDLEPAQWEKVSGKDHTYSGQNLYYNGDFSQFDIIGNNRCDLGSAVLSLTGALKKIWVSPASSFWYYPVVDNPYPIDFSYVLPNNRVRGFFYCIDIELAGGWVRIEYPYVSEIQFSGWPIDYSFGKNSFPSSSAMNPCPDEEKRRSKLATYPYTKYYPIPDPVLESPVSHRDLALTRLAQEPGGLATPADDGETIPDPVPRVDWRREQSAANSAAIFAGPEPPKIKIPTDFRNSFIDFPDDEMNRLYMNDHTQARTFTIKGCFHELTLFDTTVGSRLHIRSPITSVTVWNTDPFPCYRPGEDE